MPHYVYTMIDSEFEDRFERFTDARYTGKHRIFELALEYALVENLQDFFPHIDHGRKIGYGTKIQTSVDPEIKRRADKVAELFDRSKKDVAGHALEFAIEECFEEFDEYLIDNTPSPDPPTGTIVEEVEGLDVPDINIDEVLDQIDGIE